MQQLAIATGIAACVGLLHQHLASGVTAVRGVKTTGSAGGGVAAVAVLPKGAAIERVLPGGPHGQVSDIECAVAGNKVGGDSGVLVQGDRRWYVNADFVATGVAAAVASRIGHGGANAVALPIYKCTQRAAARRGGTGVNTPVAGCHHYVVVGGTVHHHRQALVGQKRGGAGDGGGGVNGGQRINAWSCRHQAINNQRHGHEPQIVVGIKPLHKNIRLLAVSTVAHPSDHIAAISEGRDLRQLVLPTQTVKLVRAALKRVVAVIALHKKVRHSAIGAVARRGHHITSTGHGGDFSVTTAHQTIHSIGTAYCVVAAVITLDK